MYNFYDLLKYNINTSDFKEKIKDIYNRNDKNLLNKLIEDLNNTGVYYYGYKCKITNIREYCKFNILLNNKKMMVTSLYNKQIKLTNYDLRFILLNYPLFNILDKILLSKSQIYNYIDYLLDELDSILYIYEDIVTIDFLHKMLKNKKLFPYLINKICLSFIKLPDAFWDTYIDKLDNNHIENLLLYQNLSEIFIKNNLHRFNKKHLQIILDYRTESEDLNKQIQIILKLKGEK